MTSNVGETRAFGRQEFLFRKIPVALSVGLLGVVLLYALLQDRNAKLISFAAACVPLVGGFGFAAYAAWRRTHPGQPVLVLSPAGIRYRLAGGLTLSVPWHEIQGVDTTDITMSHRGIKWKQRDVTDVLVSERFYRTAVRPNSWWHRGQAWRYAVTAKDGAIQLAIFHDHLSQPPAELRAAIEQRWRAFSRHPNAKLPAPPRIAARPGGWTPTRGQTLVATIVLATLALPLLWHWRWGYAWLRFDVPEGAAKAYLGELLDRQGVPARHHDGRIATVQRWDVAGIGASECRKHILRDTKAGTLTPTYTVFAHCVADLTLRSGETALAIFKVVVTTFDIAYELGTISRGSALVPAPVSLAEAERLCAVKGCGVRPR